MPTRIAVVGGSGSGKSTVARRLAELHKFEYVELDALHWGPNWTPCPGDEFRARVEEAISRDSWVVDGNYTGKLADLVLERSELVVWLDLPLRVTLPRLWRRTRRRMGEQTELWGGNRENWPLQPRLALRLRAADAARETATLRAAAGPLRNGAAPERVRDREVAR